MAWAPETSRGPGESSASHFHQIPSFAAMYWEHLSMIELLLGLRLKGPRGQFFFVPPCSPGRHLHGMGPRDFKRTHRLSRDPASPNAVHCCDVAGTSVNDPAAFGPKAPRPRAQFIVMPTYSPGWHLHGMDPRDCE